MCECVSESYTERSYVSNVFFSLHAFMCEVLPPTYHLYSTTDSRPLHLQRPVLPSCPHSGMFSPDHTLIRIEDGRDSDRL